MTRFQAGTLAEILGEFLYRSVEEHRASSMLEYLALELEPFAGHSRTYWRKWAFCMLDN